MCYVCMYLLCSMFVCMPVLRYIYSFKMSDDIKMGLIKMTLDPLHYEVLPPNVQTRTNFAKRFTISGAWDVNVADAPVKSTSGCLVWLPHRGINSLYHLGFVPAGTSIAGFITLTLYGAQSFTGTWNNETAIPYAPNDRIQVRISPDASSDFSFTRLVGGVVTLVSNAFAIGETAITGTLSAGVPNDTRDVFRDQAGNCFSPESLVQQSVTAKDSFLNAELHRGVAMIVGSDIPIDYTPPNTDDAHRRFGANELFFHSGPLTSIPTGLIATSYGTRFELTEMFVTPVNFTVSGFSGSNLIPGKNYVTDPINLTGVLSTEVGLIINNYTVSAGTDIGRAFVQVDFQDIFAYAQPGGAVYYQINGTRSQTAELPVVTNADAFELRLKHDAGYQPAHSFGERGLYIGTRIKVTVSNHLRTIADAAVDISFDILACVLQVTANDIYVPGELGVARVARWDDVSDKQQIKVSGDLLVQCVPEGSIAPYVTSSDKLNAKGLSINMFPFLATLYNSTSPFQRIYSLDDYRHIIANVVPRLTMKTLLDWTMTEGGSDNDARLIKDAAVAAGFWDDLASGITTGLTTVGNVANTALDVAAKAAPLLAMAGASGQFGGSACGPYSEMSSLSGGRAAGQFGSSRFSHGGGGTAMGMYGSETLGRKRLR